MSTGMSGECQTVLVNIVADLQWQFRVKRICSICFTAKRGLKSDYTLAH